MRKPRHIRLLMLVLSFIAIAACENSEQRKLYDEAVRMEHSPRGDYSIITVEAYRKVVRLHPSSKLGREAQGRIDRIKNNINQIQNQMNQRQMIYEQQRARREMEFNNLISR